jgi:hypothetical protein
VTLVGDAERGFVRQAWRGFERAGYLLVVRHYLRLERLVHAGEMAGELRSFEREVEERL